MKYLLNVYDQGETFNLEFNSFIQLKNHLIKYTDTYFRWINENVDESIKRELPNFNDDEIITADDINYILNQYNYGWWYMQVYQIETKKFIEILKEKRLSLGLTQTQVSKAINLSPNYYQQLELGINKPSYNTFLSLAKLLNIDLGELNDEVNKINLAWVIFVRNKGEALSNYRYITPEFKTKDHLCDAVVFYDIVEVIKVAEKAKNHFDVVEWDLLI